MIERSHLVKRFPELVPALAARGDTIDAAITTRLNNQAFSHQREPAAIAATLLAEHLR